MVLDVYQHYDKLSGQWEIELRKLGGRIRISRFASDCPRSHVDYIAKLWCEFLGATLTIEEPSSDSNDSKSTYVSCGG